MLTSKRRGSLIRLLARIATIILSCVAFLYFVWVALVYICMLVFPPPGWSVAQILFNVLVWTGVAAIVAFGFFQAIGCLRSR